MDSLVYEHNFFCCADACKINDETLSRNTSLVGFPIVDIINYMVVTSNNLRDTVGVRTVLNIRHEGPVGRPAEEAALHHIEKPGGRWPWSKKKPTQMNNPGFGLGGESEKGS